MHHFPRRDSHDLPDGHPRRSGAISRRRALARTLASPRDATALRPVEPGLIPARGPRRTARCSRASSGRSRSLWMCDSRCSADCGAVPTSRRVGGGNQQRIATCRAAGAAASGDHRVIARSRSEPPWAARAHGSLTNVRGLRQTDAASSSVICERSDRVISLTRLRRSS